MSTFYKKKIQDETEDKQDARYVRLTLRLTLSVLFFLSEKHLKLSHQLVQTLFIQIVIFAFFVFYICNFYNYIMCLHYLIV